MYIAYRVRNPLFSTIIIFAQPGKGSEAVGHPLDGSLSGLSLMAPLVWPTDRKKANYYVQLAKDTKLVLRSFTGFLFGVLWSTPFGW